MNHPKQQRSWISGVHGRAAGIALALAVVIVPSLIANGSARAQTYTEIVLYSFAGTPDGANPFAGLVLAEGNLYGTTYAGGINSCGCGTVFKVSTKGKETVLYSFMGIPDGQSSGDGSEPDGRLVRDTQGNLYGTTQVGGVGGGTAFMLDTAGKETVLYSFGEGAGDGQNPYAGLVRDTNGNLYGTATVDPVHYSGTVFKVDKTGKETVLHAFTGTSGGGDGAYPYGGLVRDAQGNLYGTTVEGGAYGNGTVFKVDAAGKETVLYSFTEGEGDGENPYAGLVLAAGNLYGTTYYGGAYGQGTVFKVSTKGKETVLYNFGNPELMFDGAFPFAGLVRDSSGNLYGTTYGGGASDSGTVFMVDATGNETVLYSFTGTGGDGSEPYGDLVRDKQGNLYGTTYKGGAHLFGIVYKLTP
jgi:uncharacterized repeat protein (TIGR03803 family)